MAEISFKVTNSVTRRLKAIMVAIAIFFLLSAGGIYISSLDFLNGLQRINSANIVLSLISQSIEGLDTSNKNIEKIQRASNLKDIKFTFNQSQEMLKSTVKKSLEISSPQGEVHRHLSSSLDSIYLYDESVLSLFEMYEVMPKAKSSKEIEALNTEILTANQYATDSRESLRKAQIVLRSNTDKLFNSIYQNRFRPLMVGITFSAVFFLFVITFGFAISNRIKSSLTNLKRGTEQVSVGDFSYQVPILQEDEFGFVTHTFNEMVDSIREGQNKLDLTIGRLRKLQDITAKFSEALTIDEVIEITIKEGFDDLNSSSGTVALLSQDGLEIEVKRFKGYDENTHKRWSHFPSSSYTPLANAIREKKPKFYQSSLELKKEFSHIGDFEAHNICSIAVIPLMFGTNCIGALSFNFSHEHSFSEEEQKFMLAIGRQCSQAIHRSKLFEENLKAIQLRDDFLSIASHELKTPLTPLKLQLQLLNRQIKSGEKVENERLSQLLANSDRQVSRLSRLIDDLLDVSRISSGKFNLELEKISFSKIIEDVLSQYEGQLKEVLPEIIVEADGSLEGYCDPVRIEQVLINLLTNAAKYAPGKPVKVTLKKIDGYARFSVIDQGPGIEKENQERIFRRFERVQNPENISGLGLGLFISYQIIEAHKGKIHLDSSMEKGSTFSVDLPLS